MANSSREDSVGEVGLENENLAFFFLLAKNNREHALHILLTECQAAAYYIIPNKPVRKVLLRPRGWLSG